MNRPAAATVAIAIALGFSSAGAAQTLQRLTVQTLTLSADTTSPQLEVPFHLIVDAHVRENVSELDNVNLPVLVDLELLGDERSLVSRSNGTDYRETIAVVAHHTGDITIAPVTLSAIDARDGKAKKYSSNSLTLHVTGGALKPLADTGSALASIAIALLRVVAILIGLGVAAFVAWVLFSRRRPRKAIERVVLPTAVPVVPRNPRDELRVALTGLRDRPVREEALRARSIARRLAGANDRETLADALRRPQAADPVLREVLRTLERAAFTYDADLPAAIVAAITALERACE